MKKIWIIALLGFMVVGVILLYWLTVGNVGVTYETVEVVNSEVRAYVQDVGRISSRHIRQYYGSGLYEVEEMPHKLGDRVEKGQLLLKYEDRNDLTLEMIDLEIRRVEKQMDALEAAYEEAASGTDMESVNSARIEISSIQMQLDAAKTEHERIEALYTEGIVTLSELERSSQYVNQLNSSLSIARNTYDQLSKGISDSMREKYEADIDAMLISIAILEKSKEEVEEENALYADVDGIITELNTFVGDKPAPGIMIMEIQDPTEKVVLVDFMVADALKVSQGMAAEVRDLSLGLDIQELTVDLLYPKAFVTLSELGVEENRQRVEIGLSGEGDRLPFGLEVETTVLIEPLRDVLTLPLGAIVDKEGKQFVEVLVDGQPVEREITTGIRMNGRVEVLAGVTEGEEVVLNYQED